MMYQVKAPHFCAGIEVIEKMDARYPIIIDAAPILRYTIGKSFPWFQNYCKQKEWELTLVVKGSCSGLRSERTASG